MLKHAEQILKDKEVILKQKEEKKGPKNENKLRELLYLFSNRIYKK